jgi:hypothetical protein
MRKLLSIAVLALCSLAALPAVAADTAASRTIRADLDLAVWAMDHSAEAKWEKKLEQPNFSNHHSHVATFSAQGAVASVSIRIESGSGPRVTRVTVQRSGFRRSYTFSGNACSRVSLLLMDCSILPADDWSRFEAGVAYFAKVRGATI